MKMGPKKPIKKPAVKTERAMVKDSTGKMVLSKKVSVKKKQFALVDIDIIGVILHPVFARANLRACKRMAIQ